MKVPSSATDYRLRLDQSLIKKVQSRLTERDVEICKLLEQHRVLTSHQLTSAFFPTYRAARERLVTLYRYRVIDRFRPQRTLGSAPFHYALDSVGAAVCAAERGELPKLKRFEIAESWQRSPRLSHLLMTNSFFTDLMGEARTREECALIEWWSEWRCAKEMAGIAYPDAYGEWEEDGRLFEFYLEVDRGTENAERLRAKLANYERLRQATGVNRFILFWVPSLRREEMIRRALHGTALPLATAVASTKPMSAVWRKLANNAHYGFIDLALPF